MFKWKKLGKVFSPGDLQPANWMREFAQSPSTIVYDDRVRVYFTSRPAPDEDGQYRSLISYVDLDRGDLLKVTRVCDAPVLALGNRGTFDEYGTHPASAIRDGTGIRLYYAGWTRCETVPFNAAIGVAVSQDGGNTFRRLGEGPTLSYSLDEPFLIGSPRIRRFNGLWHLWYVAGKRWIRTAAKPEPVYKIRSATSENGIDWVKQGRDLIQDRLGPDECQACPDVTLIGSTYHMFFCYREAHNYRTAKGGYRIGYASSEDLVNWVRNDELVKIDLSASGWDSAMISYPHVFALDGATYMLYEGNEMGRAGFGLAMLEDAP
jgi:predicted GH43/DUF377 family glycosyl hydrolase